MQNAKSLQQKTVAFPISSKIVNNRRIKTRLVFLLLMSMKRILSLKITPIYTIAHSSNMANNKSKITKNDGVIYYIKHQFEVTFVYMFDTIQELTLTNFLILLM
jgi:hypothetical protein